MDKILLLNTEFKLNSSVTAVTLVDSSTNDDIAKGLISDGLLLVQNQRDRRLTKLVSSRFTLLSVHTWNSSTEHLHGTLRNKTKNIFYDNL